MKNIGSEPIGLADIQQADVFGGAVGSFEHFAHIGGTPGNNQWTETFTYPEYDQNNNQLWDFGETLEVTFKTTMPSRGNILYFQFALPDGISRSTEFTVS